MNEAVNLFRSLECSEMSEPEAVVYRLKIERDALMRSSKKYHFERLHIQRFIEPGPEQDQALQKLNETYPLGYSRKELDAVNRAIAKAIVELHRFQASNLKQGEHFDSRRINAG
jgi:hypothetical protein